MTDLMGGRWPQYNPLDKMFGSLSSASQGNIPARSNAYWFGTSTLVDQATAATKKGLFVAVPVEYGDIISRVSVLVGATEGETGVKSFVALYSGPLKAKAEGLLLGQSKVKEVAIKKSKPLTESLESSVMITPTNAPFGYVYAGLIVEATTINTELGVAVPTAAQYEWFPGAPEAFSVTGTQKEAGVASATLKVEGEANAKCPLVFLT
jgi:hypothetical protein